MILKNNFFPSLEICFVCEKVVRCKIMQRIILDIYRVTFPAIISGCICKCGILKGESFCEITCKIDVLYFSRNTKAISIIVIVALTLAKL